MLTFETPLATPTSIEALQALPASTEGIKAPWLRDEDLHHLAAFPRLRSLDLKYTRLRDHDLANLPILPALTHLALPSNRDFAAPGMQHIAKLPALAHLDIAYSRMLDDAAVSALLASKSWQTLILSGCRLITDEGLKQLGESPKLKLLHLYDLGNISSASLLPLHAHPNLAALHLTGCHGLDDRALEVFASLPQLTTLALRDDAGYTAEGLKQLASCTSLQSLQIASMKLVNDDLIAAIAPALPSLQELDVCFSNVTHHAAPAISTLKELTKLDLYYIPWNDKGCEIFLELPALTELHLGNTKATKQGYEVLLECPSLRRLFLQNSSNLPATWFAALPKKLPHIELLQLNSTNVGNEHVESLQQLTSLHTLDLGYCDEVSSSTTKLLVGHPTLKDLTLTNTDISNASFAHLAQMPALERVELTYCGNLTDKGFAKLTKSQTLRNLSLQGMPISSATLAQLAEALPLEEVSVYCCSNLSNEGLQKLLAHRPNCHIYCEPELWQSDPLEPTLALEENAEGLSYFHEREELLVHSSASMRRWSFAGKKLGAVTVRAGDGARSVVAAEDGFVAGGQNSVSIWDVEAGKKHGSYKGSHYASALALSTDGAWLAIGRQKLEIVDIQAGTKQALDIDKTLLNDLTFSPDGTHLWGCDNDKLRRWSTRDWQSLPAPEISARKLHFSADGTRLYVFQQDGSMLVLDTQLGVADTEESLLARPFVRLSLLTGHGHFVEDEDFGKLRSRFDGCRVSSAAWASEELILLAVLTYEGSYTWGGNYLLICPEAIYSIGTESGKIEHAALSPDGRHIALAGYNSNVGYTHFVYQWSIASLRERFGA